LKLTKAVEFAKQNSAEFITHQWIDWQYYLLTISAVKQHRLLMLT